MEGGGGGSGGRGKKAPRTPDGAAADPFAIGLEYLQYDVHRLAISEEASGDGGLAARAWWQCDSLLVCRPHEATNTLMPITQTHATRQVGVDLSALWGKEALLLNLWTIQQHAARLVQRYERALWLCVSGVRGRQR